MNLFQRLKGANLPALPAPTNALTARLTGINRFGMTGFASLELAPQENNRLLRDGYLDNHVVFTVCDWKNQQLAKAPPVVYEVKDKKAYDIYKALLPHQKRDSYALKQKSVEEISDPGDSLVKLLTNPNPAQSWGEFIYAVGVYWDFGNALIYGVEGYKGVFAELQVLPPVLYSGQTPTVAGFERFVDSTGANAPIEGRKVLHLRRFNPLLAQDGGGLWGMSKLAAARRVLAQSTNAQEAEAEMMQNRGARTIIFPKNYEGIQNTADDYMSAARAGEEIRKRLKQAGSGGIATNSIELGAIQLSMNADDLKLMESNALSEKKICALWHVDTIAVYSAVDDASKANGETAVRKSLIEGVLPDQALVAQKLNQWLLPRYNEVNKYQRYMEFNTDVYPQLQNDKLQTMQWMTAMGSSVNERRTAMGYEVLPDPAANVVTAPTTLQPITDFIAAPGADEGDLTNDGSYA